jgi:acyl-ACP thioesterase
MFFESLQKPGLIGITPGDHRVKNEMLMEMMVDCACEHSDYAGFGVNDIERTGITFILIDWYVKTLKSPVYGQKLKVVTWGHDNTATMVERDFEIRSEEGEVLVQATSSWIALDVKNHRIARVNPEMYAPFGPEDKRLFERKKVFLRGREKLEEELSVVERQISRGSLDLVGHLHNTAYMGLAVDALPDDVYAKTPFPEFRIHYKKEITEKDKIICRYGMLDGKHTVVIQNEEGMENAMVQMW